ncbi:MAG: class I SAM-dependent methyltransferase [Kiritimatiellae bacterium]|nr:class I SAM-dependent methyltransferase [Kiritimatiellia bacterium]
MNARTLAKAWEQVRLAAAAEGRSLPSLAWKIAHRGAVWAWRRARGAPAFTLGGETYRHWVHPFILDNERTVEIPIALRAVERRAGSRILEVGNVLGAYADFPHVVVDKYERAAGVVNEDIVNYRPGAPFDLILCISTLEHVGWDEVPREPGKVMRAFEAMCAMLAPGGELLVTMPLGYNPEVDGLLAADRLQFDERRFLRRVSRDNRWQEAEWAEVSSAKFGEPYPCANAIVVGRVRRPAAAEG